MDEKKSSSSERTRNWTFIVYPESAPSNWRDILDGEHLQWVESPLHDKDINADGEPKKPHIHVLVLFAGKKTYNQVCEYTKALNAPIPQVTHNSKAMVRYMAHLDNPDKAQYSISDIISHGGVDLSSMLRISSSERYTLLREMIQFVKDNNITEYQDLVDFAMDARFDDWFPLLADNSSYFVGQYIKSLRCRQDSQKGVHTDEI